MQFNVLHVVHWPRSGITSLLYDLINGMTSTNINHGVFFFIGDDQEINKFKKTCLFVQSAKGEGKEKTYFKGLLEAINEFEPDIIHTHSFLPFLYSRIIKPSTNAVHTVHSEYPHLKKATSASLWLKQKLHLFLMNAKCVKITAISDSVYNLLLSKGVNAGQLTKINNGINLQRFKKTGATNTSYPLKRFIALGRLSEEKGFINLIEAFQKLIESDNFDIYLEIVGEGEQRALLENKVASLNLSNRVHLSGFSSKPESRLLESDVFVCSSYFEGFGLAIVEAMASECLVVSSPVGIAKQVIANDTAGVLTDDNSSESLYFGLKKTMDLKIDEIQRRVENASLDVEKNYSIKNMVEEYEKVYQSLA